MKKLLAVAAVTAVLAGTAVAHAQAGTTDVPATVAASTWSASFDGFPSAGWRSSWGVVGSGQFGFDRMDPLTGGGVKVRYGAGSSAPSCTNCPTQGGAQFYTNLHQLGRAAMATSPTLSLKYQIKFPAGHDFGRGGKLPGLYGGNPGEMLFDIDQLDAKVVAGIEYYASAAQTPTELNATSAGTCGTVVIWTR